VVHFGGPHLWNVALLRRLAARGVPAVHTLHDLDPHSGAGYGALLRPWNRLVAQHAGHVLVHGERYRRRLLEWGLPEDKITCTPLLHLFLGSEGMARAPAWVEAAAHEPWALFFGRIEKYKGVTQLITACALMNGDDRDTPSVVIAGKGDASRLWAGPLPERLELRNHLVEDEEAADLFSRCGLLVLPYLDATQSALIAAAYYFGKPVVVTRTGALPEYVVEGQTGYVVEPGHPAPLARRIEKLLADPARLVQMGASARAWYDAQRPQEWQTLVEMYERLAA
jgi:glycosyltransferase involved in cell wall biosynthesis